VAPLAVEGQHSPREVPSRVVRDEEPEGVEPHAGLKGSFQIIAAAGVVARDVPQLDGQRIQHAECHVEDLTVWIY
jgi:hypothetical protein